MSKCLVLVSESVKFEELGLDFSYPDVGDLLPVTIFCGISILFTALWLLSVWEYVQLRERQDSKHRADNHHKHHCQPKFNSTK